MTLINNEYPLVTVNRLLLFTRSVSSLRRSPLAFCYTQVVYLLFLQILFTGSCDRNVDPSRFLTTVSFSFFHCEASTRLGRGVLSSFVHNLARIVAIYTVPDGLEHDSHPSVEGCKVGFP